MKTNKLLLVVLTLFSLNFGFSQNVGINELNPLNALHVVAGSDPVRFEGLSVYSTENAILIADPSAGVVKYITMDDLYTIYRDSLKNDSAFVNGLDSVLLSDSSFMAGMADSLLGNTYFLDSIYKYTRDSLVLDQFFFSNMFTQYRDSILLDQTFFTDIFTQIRDSIIVDQTFFQNTFTQVRDSLVFDSEFFDSIYNLVSDSLLNDNAWLSELNDSIDDQNLDSMVLSSTILTTYIEDGAAAGTDLLPLASDSAFYTQIRDSLLNDSVFTNGIDSILLSDSSFLLGIVDTLLNNAYGFKDSMFSFTRDSLITDTKFFDSIFTQVRDSLVFDSDFFDSIYNLVSDSLLNDNGWLSELNDSIDDQDLDSMVLSSTILTTYIEDGAWAATDLLPLAKDSAFYTDIRDSLLNDSVFTNGIDSILLSDSSFLLGIVDTLLNNAYGFKDSMFSFTRDSLITDTKFFDSIFTQVRDSLVFDSDFFDSIYNLVSDSLLNDNAWLSELNDSIDDQDLDSMVLSSTILTTYIEDGASAATDLLPLASDSAFYTQIRDSLLNDSVFTNSIDSALLADSSFLAGIVDTLLGNAYGFKDSMFSFTRDSLLIDSRFNDSMYAYIMDSLAIDNGRLSVLGDSIDDQFFDVLGLTGAVMNISLDNDGQATRTLDLQPIIDSATMGSQAITDVIAGTGMTGGGTAGALTLNAVGVNGLTTNADDIVLGGALNQSTIITQGAFDMTYDLNGAGDFIINDGVTTRMIVDGATGNVGIGNNTAPGFPLEVVGVAHVDGLNVNGNYSLPTVDGAASQLMQTNGAGALSWVDASILGTDDQNLTVAAGGANTSVIDMENGTDVTIAGGTAVTVTEAGSTITISSSDDQNLTVTAGGANTSVIDIEDGSDVTIAGGTGITVTEVGNVITIASTGTDDQNLSVGTGGANDAEIQIENGTNITLAVGPNMTITEAGSTITIDALGSTDDQNLSVAAGGANSSIIDIEGSLSDVTVNVGAGLSISETISSFTITNTGDLNPADDYVTTFDINGGNIRLIDGGGTNTIPMSSIVENQAFTFSTPAAGTERVTITESNDLFDISQGTGIGVTRVGDVITIANTGDLSASNEYNTTFDINAGNIRLIDGGGTRTIPISSINTDAQTFTGSTPVAGTGRITISGSGSTFDLIQGTGMSISRAGNAFTFNNTVTNTDAQALSVGAGAGNTSVINLSGTATSVTMAVGAGLSISEAGSTITLTNTSPNIVQTLAVGAGTGTTSIIDLSGTASDVTLQAGSLITLTEAGNTITIAATGDGTGTDSQALSVGAGAANTSVINLSGTATSVTIAAGAGLSIAEAGSTITLTNTVTNTDNQTFSASTPVAGTQRIAISGGNTFDLIQGANITLSRAGNAITITGAAGGSGDITDVIAGNGLTGGAASGAATVDANVGNGLSIVSDQIRLGGTLAAATTIALGANNLSLTSTGGDLIVDGGTLRVDAGNNNVGIGTVPTAGYALHVNGRLRSNGINETSDRRYKKDIKQLESALDKVLKLRGVSYTWRQDEYPEQQFADGTQLGVIAQEIEEIYPEVVHTDEKGYKSVEYSHLVPALIEAIKELKAENADLKASNEKEINELKAEMNEMKEMIKSLQYSVEK